MNKPQKNVVALAKNVIEGIEITPSELHCLTKASGIKGEPDLIANKILRDYVKSSGFFKKAA